MDFAIGFGQDSGVNDIGEQARSAEALGYTHATYIDMGNLAPEVQVMLSLMGAHTTKIHVGQGVTDPVTYNPAVIANAAATLREQTGDRHFVGLGVGGPYGKPFVRPAKIDELKESIKFIREYTAGEEAKLGDHSWHCEWVRRSQYRGRSVPVYIAVAGRRTCELAGQVADGALSIGTDSVIQSWRREMIEKAATEAGRDPGDIRLWARTQVHIAASKEAAHEETAPYAATCAWELYNVLRQKTPDMVDLAQRIERKHPGLVDEFKEIFDVWEPYATERLNGPQAEITSQRVVDFFLATGTIDDVGEKIQSLEEEGYSGVWSVLYALRDQEAAIESVGKELIPKFRASKTRS
jgi:alkanesulfonate monooxygenase SsuD/methylene tetrahydromethanopterin reductase-like flavin-dependent oxidoreductase (luciferase family)